MNKATNRNRNQTRRKLEKGRRPKVINVTEFVAEIVKREVVPFSEYCEAFFHKVYI